MGTGVQNRRMSTLSSERLKYEEVWDNPSYREISPGEDSAPEFVSLIDDGPVIDFGCGTGRAATEIARTNEVLMLDIANNCLDDHIVLTDTMRFSRHCIWDKYCEVTDWGFCCDVLEHIPENKVDSVLENIRDHCMKGAYLRIYLHKDNGKFHKDTLHLTVRPFEWWKDKIESLWDNVQSSTNGTAATFFMNNEDTNA